MVTPESLDAFLEQNPLPPDNARADAIEECAKIADGRARTLREKAKSVTTASRQSYFAQAIEARVIAEHIRALKTAAPDTTEGGR
jgi:hypothetical protein